MLLLLLRVHFSAGPAHGHVGQPHRRGARHGAGRGRARLRGGARRHRGLVPRHVRHQRVHGLLVLVLVRVLLVLHRVPRLPGGKLAALGCLGDKWGGGRGTSQENR